MILEKAFCLIMDKNIEEHWKKQIASIQNEVQELLRGRKIFLDTYGIIEKNVAVQKNISTWWDYYKISYTYFVISKIFHQIDKDNRADNLINLLENLYENCEIITSSWYVNHDTSSLSTVEFEKKFGKNHLQPSNIYADIGELLYVTKDVKEFRHKRIAHRDKSKNFNTTIQIKNIDESINTIEKLSKKYTLLLEQRGLDLNISDENWPTSFTIPWIPNEK